LVVEVAKYKKVLFF